MRRDNRKLTIAFVRCGLAGLLIGGCYRGLDSAADPNADKADDGGMDDDDGGDATGDDAGEDAAPGPAQPLHRLNRLEYNNTLRDLLGTDLRPADAFGPDPEANGFDNMADQLGISPVLLDAYDRAARDAIADALDDRPAWDERFASNAIGAPGGYPIGDLWALTGNVAEVTVDVPQDGDAEIVLTAGASVIGPAPHPEVAIEVDGAIVAAFAVQGSAPSPHPHVHPMALAAGAHTVRVIPTNFMNDAVANTSNNVLVAALQVRSVLTQLGPGRERIFVCDPIGGLASCYDEIIHTFAFRAWRRPLTPDEKQGLADLFQTLRQHGESGDDALRLVMRTVMLSPKFFYRARTIADADADEWLDDYVLASRLSYFLWSSMPDDRLFQAAAEDRLATDEGLSEAVAWMLQDPKAQALLDGFAEQWLATRHLATASPSPEVYPEFDETVRAAMTLESKLFFGDFLHNGQPVTAFLRPSFAHRSDRLAAHYGLPPIGSDELVRVAVTDGERRGLLSLGAWLTASSDAQHSSPIRRGRWVSDTVLCTPVPPPPPGIEIEPIDPNGATTVREQLEQHRSDPACASCHALLDVLGIGFEDYDGVARPVLDHEVDNLGELPDGRAFEGADELAELLGDSEVFAGCLAKKLYTYAVGRAPQPYDTADLDAIATAAIAQQLDLPGLIDAIVHTPGFRSPGVIEEVD